VNVAEAEFVAESVAVTVFTPVVEVGTVKDAEIVPVPEAVTLDGFVVTPTALNVIVTVEPGKKFEPVTVTGVPTGPVVGLREIEGVVTVNVCGVAGLVPSVALTLLDPALAVVGTAKVLPVAGRAPVAVAVTDKTVPESNCTVTVALGT
jgi:hypothetical protein